MTQIKPHGGKLINRTLNEQKRKKIINESSEYQSVPIKVDLMKDVENIASGLFSPLEGFICREDYESILYNKRLSNGLPWTLPIILDTDNNMIKEGDDILLKNNGHAVAVMRVDEIYSYDKRAYAEQVYGTNDAAHPGVAKTYSMKDKLLAGKISLINESETPYFKYAMKPAETRNLFKEKGWEKVVGFQTRNVAHLGHEYLQKSALTMVDGLFINPVIGKKKIGDFKDEVILESYEVLIDNYFPKDRVVLGIFQTEMRYAGPREAIFHAIVRKNYGCTHFIIGRDHAGVGSFYHPFAAQEIFKEFPDIGIEPMFFMSFFYCNKCGGISNDKVCPHTDRVDFSGTKMRQMIEAGKRPPSDSMRPEVADVILKSGKPFVE
ncbi:MAG: sulfate adenylyltransferase [Candidatus Methanoperedens sp.]|nr:sulfate adenylyltransferase [Candidatus Methanoperedens sp.]MCE8428306.1 sulfate adenylyltransferase [Candidatus Methanoperedens sp.]